jgi:hypothetical protein
MKLCDSLSHLKLVTEIEEAFGFIFSMKELNAIDSVRKLKALVNGYVGNPAVPPIMPEGRRKCFFRSRGLRQRVQAGLPHNT